MTTCLIMASILTPTAGANHRIARSSITPKGRQTSQYKDYSAGGLVVNLPPDGTEIGSAVVDRGAIGSHAWRVNVSQENPQVRFEQDGSRLTAIEITRDQRSPVIAVLQRTLFALGIVVSSYQARARATRLVERVVIERTDGGTIDGTLSVATKAAILPIALDQSAERPPRA